MARIRLSKYEKLCLYFETESGLLGSVLLLFGTFVLFALIMTNLHFYALVTLIIVIGFGLHLLMKSKKTVERLLRIYLSLIHI